MYTFLSFFSSASDSFSPLHSSHQQTSEHSLPHWLTEAEAVQSQMSINSDEQISANDRRAVQSSVDGSGLMAPFDMSRPVYIRPIQIGPKVGLHQSSRLQSVPFKSVKRHRLASCLPSCLQPEDLSD